VRLESFHRGRDVSHQYSFFSGGSVQLLRDPSNGLGYVVCCHVHKRSLLPYRACYPWRMRLSRMKPKKDV
jgi:hypothetical protein